jgi:hypothetical protein
VGGTHGPWTMIVVAGPWSIVDHGPMPVASSLEFGSRPFIGAELHLGGSGS